MPKTHGEAYKVLENLQEQIYKKLGRSAEFAFSKFDPKSRLIEAILSTMTEDQQRLFRESLDSAKDMGAPPTRYETAYQYWQMISMAEDIEESIKAISGSVPAQPAIGTLPTGRINATALHLTKQNEYLIVFESGLQNFAVQLSNIVIATMPFLVTDDIILERPATLDSIQVRIKEKPEIVEAFRDTVISYLLTGDALPSEHLVTLTNNFGVLAASQLLYSMMLFVMGHEYAHLVLGHLSQESLVRVNLLGEGKLFEHSRDWQQEFGADLMGCDLMFQSRLREGNSLSLSYWGVDLFF